MPKLQIVDPDQFLVDSFELGRRIYLSGFRPKHAISIWRGGTPVGLGVDAFFRARGLRVSHTTIATESFTGIGQRSAVTVKNLEHLTQVICPEDPLLILDDVYETGETVREVVEVLRRTARANAPRDIRVGAVHRKPDKVTYDELPTITLHDVPGDIWIDYPHELADLVDPDDPEDSRIRDKGEDIWRILRQGPLEPAEVQTDLDYHYMSSRELLLDSLRLGVQIAHDPEGWRPDFLVALWPGGVMPGLPVHEVYKYFLKKTGSSHKPPDHISINTLRTRNTQQSSIVGMRYLEDHINRNDHILVIDTTFRAGRLVNNVVARLKEVLRRNLDHRNVRVASVYYNPEDKSTWTVRPDIKKPNYFIKMVHKEVIYPHSVHKLPQMPGTLRTLNPKLWSVLNNE